MKSIEHAIPNVAMLATDRQRQQVLRRVKLGDAVANVVAALAYPTDQDRADRPPALCPVGGPEVPA